MIDWMRGLTVQRPWDYALLHGKTVENRKTLPPRAVIGERIALHAGLAYDYDGLEFIKRTLGRCETLQGGVIFATVRVVGWVRIGVDDVRTQSDDALVWAFSNPWFFGPVGIVLDELRPLAKPVGCRGMQGWWPVPEETRQRVIAQEAAA